MGQVYRHIAPNGKSYVGMTIYTWQERAGANPASSYSSKFRAAIHKYGWENFSHEILEEHDDPTILRQREIYWINHFNSAIEGYNSCRAFPMDPQDWMYLQHEILADHKTGDFSGRELVVKYNVPWNEIREFLIESGAKLNGSGFRSKAHLARLDSDSWRVTALPITCAGPSCSKSFTPKRKEQKCCSKSCNGARGQMISGPNGSTGAPLGNKNGVGQPAGGLAATHNRWHLKRNLRSPDCIHCQVV